MRQSSQKLYVHNFTRLDVFSATNLDSNRKGVRIPVLFRVSTCWQLQKKQRKYFIRKRTTEHARQSKNCSRTACNHFLNQANFAELDTIDTLVDFTFKVQRKLITHHHPHTSWQWHTRELNMFSVVLPMKRSVRTPLWSCEDGTSSVSRAVVAFSIRLQVVPERHRFLNKKRKIL